MIANEALQTAARSAPQPAHQSSVRTTHMPLELPARDPFKPGSVVARSDDASQPTSELAVTHGSVSGIVAEEYANRGHGAATAHLTTRLDWLAILYASLSGLWAVAVAILLSRLALANWLMFRICQAACPAPPTVAHQCRALAATLRISAPPVLVGSGITSPCLVGWWRPTILLPVELRAMSSDALAHELAHLMRRDCLWNFVTRLIIAALPFQPLIWLLARRIEHAADEVCDDYVLANSRDRAAYARELVDIAERFQPDWPVATVAVGIAALRSALGKRVLRILDTSRVLSTHTRVVTLLTIIVMGTFGVLAGGFIAAPRSPSTLGSDDDDQVLTSDVGMTQPIVSFSGHVLDPDGQPFSGARIYLAYDADDRQSPPVRATSGPGGRFEFTVSKSEFDKAYGHDPWGELPPRSTARVVVVADGFGPAWFEVPYPEANSDLALRLVTDDVPIDGRVVDLEGRGVAGVSVRVFAITAWPDDGLELWIGALWDAGEFYKAAAAVRSKELPQNFSGLPESVVTDSEGRFQLTGVGRDRAVSVRFIGPTIATTQNYELMTRPSEPIRVPWDKQNPTYGNAVFYGASLEHAAAPTRPIVGVVRDKETGTPIAGATVQSDRFAGSPLSGRRLLETTADSEGRFRLVGMPKGSGNQLLATHAARPYLATTREVPDGPGLDAIQVDFELSPCVLIRGRVTDGQTGEPVAAEVEYFVPEQGNPNLKNAGSFETLRVRTRDDGSFTVNALPGRGLIAVRADVDRYIVGDGARSIQGLNELGMFPAEPHYCHPDIFHHIIEVNPSQDAASHSCDVALDAGRSVAGVVLGPDETPLTGVRIAGARGLPLGFATPSPSADFKVTGIDPTRPRPVLFYHPELELGAVRFVDGSEPTPLPVRLERCATVTGRLVDETGTPRGGTRLSGSVSAGQLNILIGRGGFFSADTDEQGRFTCSGLIPGVKYDLAAAQGNLDLGHVFDGLSFDAGESRDLADLQLKRARTNRAGDDGAAAATARQTVELRGRVLRPDGTPANNANVYLVARYSGGESLSDTKLEAVSDAHGEFMLRYPESQFAGAVAVRIIALADGFGPDWSELNNFKDSPQVTLRLAMDDVPISGRVLDLEGNAVAAAKVSLVGIRVLNTPDADAFIEAVKSNNLHSAFTRIWHGSLPAGDRSVETDQQGRFRLTGVGRGRVADLLVQGDTIEHNRLHVLTHATEPVVTATRDGGREPEKFYGATFDHFALPSRPIVGTVRDQDTGKPIAGVQITAGSMSRATSDEQGRFELVGTRKSQRYGLIALPQVGASYLIGSRSVPDPGGLEPMTADIELVRGILVSGLVTDKATGKPISGNVRYFPLFPNEHLREGIGYSAAGGAGATCESHTADDGSFSIPVLPGPGFIAVSAHDRARYMPAHVRLSDFFDDGLDYTVRPQVGRELLRVATSSQAWALMPPASFHAIVLLKPEKDDSDFIRNITLERAGSVSGELVDGEGQPVTGATAIGLAHAFDHTPNALEDASFRITGLTPLEPRTVLFRHREKRLVGLLIARGDEQQPVTVTMLPWGEVSGRILDDEGNPRPRVKIGTITGRHANDKAVGRLPDVIATDDRGRFRIDGLVPALHYSFEVLVGDMMVYDLDTNGMVSLAPGEVKDLGDVKLKAMD